MTREVTIFTCVIFLMPIVACLAPTARGLAPSTDRKETNTIYRHRDALLGRLPSLFYGLILWSMRRLFNGCVNGSAN